MTTPAWAGMGGTQAGAYTAAPGVPLQNTHVGAVLDQNGRMSAHDYGPFANTLNCPRVGSGS